MQSMVSKLYSDNQKTQAKHKSDVLGAVKLLTYSSEKWTKTPYENLWGCYKLIECDKIQTLLMPVPLPANSKDTFSEYDLQDAC